MKTFGWLLGLILMVGVLSACAGGQGPAEGMTNETASAETEHSQQDDAIIDTDARIASMSIHMTNNLLALGITPAGSVIGGGVQDFLPHVKNQLEGVEKLGVIKNPNLEAVVSLKPDYIFTDSFFGAETVDSLEKIAPVISTNLDKGTWRDQLLETSSHFALEDKAQSFIEEYDAKAKRVGELIHEELGYDAKVMAVRVTAKNIRVQSTGRPLGPILYDDLKLTPPKLAEDISKAEPYAAISVEVLPESDADAIILMVNNDEDARKAFATLENNPLWSHVKAVKNDHVYAVDGQKWLDYSSLGQSMALDNAEELFTNK
ncbi:ABC transporter substrate-binding protein [Aureibacillus halotolerans]|uniref:Iron complex transport system substrate-binding protein n=1 Tax=Aureibacillus halotolerans TaxID=1508390 RepID=A0A4R6U8C4_9BACI|nr:ABC transporter substrate-binding protein [Aureibacillus halotolerans]TDQ41203.1 iron complex transport system substrate-binding protein [Aureibacillus halotolerans]